jgi:malate dehydrogenase (oxaloacetate-decarboxylating)(NADP+)
MLVGVEKPVQVATMSSSASEIVALAVLASTAVAS